jgi:predicted small lipoprotein YifL
LPLSMTYSVAVIQGLLTLVGPVNVWNQLPMQTLKTTLLILLSAVVLSACGLRGPLYLPDEDPATDPTSEEGENPDENNNKEEEEDQVADSG